MNIDILIVEDEEVINDYLAILLKDYNVVQTYDGKEALKAIEKSNFHIIITDIIMPNKSGLELLETLNEKNILIPTVVLSALEDDESLQKAYDLGAIDYLVKPVKESLLLKKVENLIKYIYNISTDIIVNTNSNEVILNGENVNLTKIEFEIFKLLYSNPSRVYTKENIIEVVWNGNYSMSNKIIEVNMFNIRKKLSSYSRHLKSKRGVGYYFEN